MQQGLPDALVLLLLLIQVDTKISSTLQLLCLAAAENTENYRGGCFLFLEQHAYDSFQHGMVFEQF